MTDYLVAKSFAGKKYRALLYCSDCLLLGEDSENPSLIAFSVPMSIINHMPKYEVLPQKPAENNLAGSKKDTNSFVIKNIPSGHCSL